MNAYIHTYTHANIHMPFQMEFALVHGGFVLRFCLEGFVQGGFCTFPLLSEYFRYNRKLNITFNFRFHMYDKKFKMLHHLLLTSLPCHKLLHLLGSSPSSVTYFMDGPIAHMKLNAITNEWL